LNAALFLACGGRIVKTGLLSDIGKDFQDFFTARKRSAHISPSFLGLKETIVSRVVVRPHEMRDISFGEDGVKELCFKIIFQVGNLKEIFHGATL
jgi:hypothetical protein